MRKVLREFVGKLALDDTMGRLVHLLLRHFDGGRYPNHPNLIKDLSQEELAHMMGEPKREGIVDTAGGELHVLIVA